MATKTSPSSPELENDPGQEEYQKLTARFNPDNKDNHAAGNPTDPRGNDAASGDESDPRDKLSPDEIKDREESPAAEPEAPEEKLGKGFTGSGKTGSTGWRRYVYNRKSAAGGGIIGLIIASIFGFSVLQGPLQLIHLGQILQHPFSKHESDSSNRLGKLYRYAKSGNIGETRVSRVGSKIFGKTIQQLEDVGVKIETNSLDRPLKTTFEVDKLKTQFPELDGMGDSEVKSFLAKKLNVSADLIQGSRGNYFIDQSKFDLKTSRLLTKSTVGLLDDGKIVTGIKGRTLAKFFGLPSLFHPLERKFSQSLNDITNGRLRQQTEAQKEKARQNALTDPVEAKGQAAVEDVKSSKFTKGIVGALAFTGSACLVYTTADSVVKINRDLVVLPAVVQATDKIAVGSQIQSNQDFEMASLEAVSNSLKDPATGKTIWDGKAMQALEGSPNPSGTDIPSDYAQTFSGNSTALNIKNGVDSLFKKVSGGLIGAGGLFGACGTIGTVVQIVGTLAISAASAFGEVVSAGTATPGIIAGLAVFWGAKEAVNVAASGIALHFIEKFVIGKATIKLAADAFSGPVGGDLLAYGARAAANTSAIAAGGISLGNNASTIIAENDQQQFQSSSLANRLFNAHDSRSAISKFIDNTNINPQTTTSSIGSLFTNFGGMFTHAFSMLTPRAFAADQPYDWGFPQYGIPDSILNNSSLSDPYANADQVAKLLDGNDGNKYISKAMACFGVAISKNNADSVWDVTPEIDVNPADSSYTDKNCGDMSDENWQRVTMFVFDTNTMKAAACYENDEQSCADFGGSSSTSQQSTTTTTASTGVDMSQIFNDSSNIACAAGTKDLGIQDGYHDGNLVKIRICAVAEIHSFSEESRGGYGVSGADGGLVVNSRVSGAVLAMAQAAKKDGVNLTANSGFRTMSHQQSLCPCDGVTVAVPGYSNHQMGLAIDFGGGLTSNPGPVTGNAFWDWLSANAANFSFKNYPREAWHWSVTGN